MYIYAKVRKVLRGAGVLKSELRNIINIFGYRINCNRCKNRMDNCGYIHVRASTNKI